MRSGGSDSDGAPWVGFRLTPGRSASGVVEAASPIFDEREVTDSGGNRSRRDLHPHAPAAGRPRNARSNSTWSDRGGMRFPMLLGRTALEGMFTVDPSCSFLHPRPPRHAEHGESNR